VAPVLNIKNVDHASNIELLLDLKTGGPKDKNEEEKERERKCASFSAEIQEVRGEDNVHTQSRQPFQPMAIRY
jgi:hypothetical protein